ncbi:hypothetical protein THICB1_50140 [Thiomonas arsenitoxydans]|uniref:Uncharacterized protein n=1 Tax=Thiomonas arsenitoxydans (strain DSM 22701 / CIP 110005 / 3As) TaxID=426114 RepID=A0ABP1Z732_THIA3|nr:hypothetical protein THICB6_20193 [Thiomonas arsenitoxydans]CQR45481.1 hypothetical protein THICB3620293 [Thiomonas sp. CB3]VDY06351.1 protein of unknown function [Thiomonas sp. Bio17B3]VDY10353.1 protein of unknown function [Thiomonas sp. Sup16B3]VDY14622.1 conserved protein of unknown function [Thiomonas sp. OC7]VDY16198.1 protein of unknown function [Thiomonas sp. CB2]
MRNVEATSSAFCIIKSQGSADFVVVEEFDSSSSTPLVLPVVVAFATFTPLMELWDNTVCRIPHATEKLPR